MAAIKRGFLEFPAYNLLGDLSIVDIGLPDDLPELTKINREIITKDWVNSYLPERPLDAHKGVFGTALIIAGSDNYPGAAILAGESSYRAGAGLVRIAVPESIYEGVIGVLPEATWIRLSDQGGGISSSAIPQIKGNLDRITACLIGPGLGIRSETAEFLEEFLELNSLPPLVIDADGLRLAKQSKKWPGFLPQRSILTPHPGEFAEITGKSIPEIQDNRVGITEKYSAEWNQILVLKGAHTVIAGPTGRTMVYLGAEPAMAKAGSGDVLAGIITGLLAQGLSSFEASAVGVWLHGEAGKLAKKKQGDSVGVIAGDISSAIGDIIP
jgi:NAD(P)H-hydrate epimerase